jgi:archaemetzincin
MKKRITLLPVGEIEEDLLQWLERSLKKVFKIEIGCCAVMKFPRDAYNPVRDQYLAAIILMRMRKCLSPEEHEKVLGITERDLYADDMNFIFGQAEMPGNVAVISLARLRPSFYGYPERPKIIKQRMLKEAVHELGHAWGLKHCSNPFCVMHFSLSLKDTDKKDHNFCSSCRSRLKP